ALEAARQRARLRGRLRAAPLIEPRLEPAVARRQDVTPDQPLEIRVECANRPAVADGANDQFRARRAANPRFNRYVVVFGESGAQYVGVGISGVFVGADAAQIDDAASLEVEAELRHRAALSRGFSIARRNSRAKLHRWLSLLIDRGRSWSGDSGHRGHAMQAR